MDKEQEFQSLGFFGILKESFTITLLWRKIFTQIMIATIFPLSLLFLGHVQVSEHLFADILHNEKAPSRYYDLEGSSKSTNISGIFSSDWIAFWSFKVVYFVFFLALSLLSTSAVVYTIACIYTSKETTFAEVMCVVPKVWKRLMITFSWNFIVVLAYNVIAFLVLVQWFGTVGPSTAGLAILCVFIVIYVMGFVYISIIWHLANVVSVLEEDCGIEAIIKSKAMVKGKLVVLTEVFLVLNSCFVLIQQTFQRFVVMGDQYSSWSRIGYGIICFSLLSGFTLLGLIIQTIVYFVCKSYHHEIIDKEHLGNHLIEVYLGDYAPLRSKDVQLEQFYV